MLKIEKYRQEDPEVRKLPKPKIVRTLAHDVMSSTDAPLHVLYHGLWALCMFVLSNDVLGDDCLGVIRWLGELGILDWALSEARRIIDRERIFPNTRGIHSSPIVIFLSLVFNS